MIMNFKLDSICNCLSEAGGLWCWAGGPAVLPGRDPEVAQRFLMFPDTSWVDLDVGPEYGGVEERQEGPQEHQEWSWLEYGGHKEPGALGTPVLEGGQPDCMVEKEGPAPNQS